MYSFEERRERGEIIEKFKYIIGVNRIQEDMTSYKQEESLYYFAE